jgi:hypothetical protein
LESLSPIPSVLLGNQFAICPDLLHTVIAPSGWFRMLMFPPDMLHTVCGGVLKSWIFWVMVIVVRVSEMDDSYKESVATLDACIADFPCKQSIGGKVKAFPKGISEYVKAATSSGISSKECSTSGNKK